MRGISAFLAAATLSAQAFAQAPGEKKDPIAPRSTLPAEARDFGLAGPNLHASERRSGGMNPGDFNGDGHLDFVTVANDKSVLELFLYDAKSEEKFTKETVTLNDIVTSIVPADVNGDGRTDVFMTLQGTRVSVMYQSRDGRLQPGTELSIRADSAIGADLNGDGAGDILLNRKGVFEVLRGKGRSIDLDPAQTFYTSGELASDPMTLDLDMDGKMDIVYQDAGTRDRLFVRMQAGDGSFPSEFIISPGMLRGVAPLHQPGMKDSIVAIQDKTRQLIQLRLSDVRKDNTTAEPIEVSQLHLVPFDPETTSDKLDTTVADIDGDGRLDLVVSSPKMPALRVLRQERTGALAVSMIPSLEGIEQLMSLPSKSGEPAPLLIFSKKEKAAGLVVGKKGSDTLPFPRLLPELGAPRATAVVKIGDKPHIVALNDADTGVSLKGYELKGDSLGAAQEILAEGQKLELKSGEGNGLSAMDLNQDGREDLIVFSEFKPASLFTQEASGKFVGVGVRGGVLEGLLSEMSRGRLVAAKIDTAEKPLVLAVKAGFVRAFTLDAKNNVVVAEQFNGRNSRSRLVAATTGNFRSRKQRDVAMLDIGNKLVSFYGVKDEKGAYEEIGHADLDSGDYRSLEVMDLDGDERDDLLLVAADRVAVLYTRRLNSGFETVASAKTEVEDGGYSGVWTAQIFPGGPEEIVALEGKESMLEFFVVGKDADDKPELQRFYQFKGYEIDSSMASRSTLDSPAEPREVIAVDFDENQKPSILALTHDFVIRYTRKNRDVKK